VLKLNKILATLIAGMLLSGCELARPCDEGRGEGACSETSEVIERESRNYYQIINDSQAAVNSKFILDEGYSVFVNYDGKKFLMDTGHYKHSFQNNLKAAGVRANELDFVFMSHRHKDHATGWPILRRQNPSLPIYTPPDKGLTDIPGSIEVKDYLQLSPDIFLMHTHDDRGSKQVTDELSLLLLTSNGPYLFTTNSHTNFVIKLQKAKRLAERDVYFYSGHTGRRSTAGEAILKDAKKLKAMNVKKISPSHSRPRHDKLFQKVFGSEYLPALVGNKIPLPPPTN